MKIYLKILLYFIFLNVYPAQNFYSDIKLINNIKIDYLNSDHGLSNDVVYKIIEDSLGLIWIGTSNGLSIYDGSNFEVYTTKNNNDRKKIPGDSVYDIIEEKNGVYWIGTSKGLCRIDYKKNLVRVFTNDSNKPKSIAGNFIQALLKDKFNNLWVAASGKVQKIVYKNDEIFFETIENINEDIKDYYIIRMGKDKDGNVYFCGNKNNEVIIKKYNPISKKSEKDILIFDGLAFITKIIVEDDGKYLLGTWRNGLIRYDPVNKTRNNILNTHTGTSLNVIVDLIKDSESNVWITTRGDGLFLLENKNKSIHQFRNERFNRLGINSNFLSSVVEDRNGNMWVGSLDNGVNIIDRNNLLIKNYYLTPENKDTFSDDNITVIHEDKNGYIWLGTKSGGINIFDAKNNKFKAVYQSEQNINHPGKIEIDSFFEDLDNNLWVGTGGKGIYKILIEENKNPLIKTPVIKKIDLSLKEDFIYKMDLHPDGYIVAISWGKGIIKLNPKTEKSIRFTKLNSALKHSSYLNLNIDGSGNIWLATSVNGLIVTKIVDNKISEEQIIEINTKRNNLPDDVIYKIFQNKKNEIIVGSERGPARITYSPENIFNDKKISISGFPEVFNSENLKIFSILKDGYSNLWFFSSKKIIKITPEKNYSILENRNGFINKRFNYWASYVTKNNQIILGGLKGFSVFDSRIENTKYKNSSLLRAGIKLFDKNIEVGDSISGEVLLKEKLLYKNKLELKYSQNIVSLFFTYPGKKNANNVSLSYFLEGFSSEWSPKEFDNKITFTNLNPGEHLLLVKAYDLSGREIGETNLLLIIIPPFWMTLWFKTLSTILLVLFIIFVHKVRVRKIKQHNDELEAEISERKIVESKLLKTSKDLERNLIFQRALIEAIPIPVYYKDNEGRYIGYNKAFEEFIGLKNYSVVGKTASDIWPEKIALYYTKKEEEIIKNNRLQIVEEKLKTKNLRDRNIIIARNTYKDENNNIAGIIGTFVDITELKKVNKKLSLYSKELEQIIYIFSHDFRTPLVNLNAFSRELNESMIRISEIIVENDLPGTFTNEFNNIFEEEIKQSTSFIKVNVIKLEKLLNGLLKISRIQRGSLKFETIQTKKMIEAIVNGFNDLIKDTNIIITVFDLPEIKGDLERLKEVFSNIIHNSIIYRNPDQECKIEIGGLDEINKVTFWVKDNGIGISKKYQTKIFDIYHQLNPEKYEGEGIGLTIANKIVEKHGGRIEIVSEDQVGTTVFITLNKYSVDEFLLQVNE